jgi:hypothetical protein
MWYNGATGKRNASLDFDGNDYIQTTSSDLSTANNFTVVAWFSVDDTTLRHIIWEGDVVGNGWGNGGITQQEMHISIGNYNGSDESDKLSFFMGDTHEANDAGVLHIAIDFSDTGTWYHVAAVVSNLDTSPSAELFLNGVSQGTDTGTTTRTSRSNWDTDLRIGRPGVNAREFDGQIDEARVYNYALTQQQINDIYNSGAVHFGQ